MFTKPVILGIVTATVGLLLVACGGPATTGTRTPAVYSAPGNMASARSGHTITLIADGKALVTGGISPDLMPFASTEMLDLGKGTWSATASMAEARVGHTAMLLADSKVLVAGGVNRDTGSL